MSANEAPVGLPPAIGILAGKVAEDVLNLVRVRHAYDRLIAAIDVVVAANPSQYATLVADLRRALEGPPTSGLTAPAPG